MIFNKEQRQGFTIIEIVLVLAIAGLIFLMVFIALPALQRSQRNEQRKRDLGLIMSAMNQWYTNNRNPVDDAYNKRNDKNYGFCTFYKRYVGDEVLDPSTGLPYRAGLWGATKVTDCKNGKEYSRSNDPEVAGATSSTWPAMEPGDFQYDQGAYCKDEIFVDVRGKVGLKTFAFRVRYEGGATNCMDNGVPFDNTGFKNSLDNYRDFAMTINTNRN